MAGREPEAADRPGVAPRAATVDPRLGLVVAGRYRLLGRLGAGGMGTVYEAEQVTTRRRVAVKLLQPGLGRIDLIRKRFEREAFAASRLDHPHIVGVIDFGSDDDGLFLVMELVRGPTLGTLLEEGRLPAERALLIARQILQALAHAHAAGVVHRDLKPDNVMVLDAGGGGADRDHVKLLDFGIAKLLGDAESEVADQLTQAGVAFGTPEYMSPEQAQGRAVDHRADLYALGVMIFELLAGRRPFEASDKLALLQLQIARPAPTLARVAPDAVATPLLEAFVRRALAKKEGERFQSADEMLAAFDAAALDYLSPQEAVPARAATATAMVRAETRPGTRASATELGMPEVVRRRWFLAAGAGLLAVALILLALIWRFGGQGPIAAEARGRVSLVLAQLFAARGDGGRAFDAYERAVDLRPRLAADPQLVADVSALGSRARDRELRARARDAADAWGFGDKVDRVESFSLDLAQGATCAERRTAVGKLRALVDKRAVAALARARAVGDANKCLERDAREAIEFLEALP